MTIGDFKINKEAYEKLAKQKPKRKRIYKEKDMIIQVPDDENWVDPDYNHGHPKRKGGK